MPDPVASQSSEANDLIGSLRETAQGIKALGDENEHLREEKDGLMGELHAARTDEERAGAELDEWRELLEDFRRGIRDRDELIEQTIGR